MTKLEAVNYILTGNGMRPVPQLDTSGQGYIAEAERILDLVELEIQGRGWHYNTLTKVVLSPDGDDHIDIPAGVITIDSDDTDSSRNVTQQGDHLFDLDNNTDEFDGDLKVTYTLRLEFPCIPQPIKEWIASEAAHRMCVQYTPQNRARLYEREKDVAKKQAWALRFNGDKSNANALTGADAARFRGRVRSASNTVISN